MGSYGAGAVIRVEPDENITTEDLPETPVKTPGRATDNEGVSRFLREALAYQMKRKAEGKHDTCTFAVKGAVGSSEDAFIVTPEEMRKFGELLKKHDDIMQAARECWKDNPAVLKRLEELGSE